MKLSRPKNGLSDSEILVQIENLYQPCADPMKVSQDECQSCEQRISEAFELAIKHSLPAKQADFLLRLCTCAISHSDPALAWQHINHVFEIVEKGLDYPNLHKAYNVRGRLHWLQSHYQMAIDDYEKALPLFRKAGLHLDVAGMCMNLSSLYSCLGKPEEALHWNEQASEGFMALENPKMLQVATSTKGNILSAMGRLEEALAIKKQCEEFFASVNDLRQQSIELNALAVISHKMNHSDLAIEYCHKSITIKEKLNDYTGLAMAWLNLGIFYLDTGDSEKSEVYYKMALERYLHLGNENCAAKVYNNLGNIYKNRKDYEQAKDCFEKALPLVVESQDSQDTVTIKGNLGLIYIDTKSDVEKGLNLLKEAHRMAHETEDLYHYVSYGAYLAIALAEVNRPQEALDLLKEIHRIAEQNKYEKLLSDIYKAYDLAYAALGDLASARENLLKHCQTTKERYNIDLLDKITEMKTKYETEKKEQEAEIYRLKNIELEEKNRMIEEQKSQLQDTLAKLQNSEIRYNFVSEELSRSIKTTLIGSSEVVKNINNMIAMVAKSDKTNVLITGETGTGKEIVARNIHSCSKRGKLHFYAVNCSAVPDTLFESQFFGHEKDAFTGANTAKIGWFEIANRSTLFLDEIGSLSMDQQAKLLRVLEERCIVRVGSHREIPVDLRIISATNVNLMKSVEEDEFRRDLYHRLAIFVINIPPLRNHREDIPSLLKHFVGAACQTMNKKINKVDKSVINLLSDYEFPGNVRELRNMVERAVLVADSSTLRREYFLIPSTDVESFTSGGIIPLDALERDMLIKALQNTNYNRVQAAKLLGVDRKVVERKIVKHNISLPDL